MPTTPRPPVPPVDRAGALAKVRAAEDAWNTRRPELVASAYTEDSQWRNRHGQWWRSHGNEMWELDAAGSMSSRQASINDVPIRSDERRIFGPRPDTAAAVR